jgi:hypothetical protein
VGNTARRHWPPQDAQPAQSEPVALFVDLRFFYVGRLVLGRPPRGLERKFSGAACDSCFFNFFLILNFKF